MKLSILGRAHRILSTTGASKISNLAHRDTNCIVYFSPIIQRTNTNLQSSSSVPASSTKVTGSSIARIASVLFRSLATTGSIISLSSLL